MLSEDTEFQAFVARKDAHFVLSKRDQQRAEGKGREASIIDGPDPIRKRMEQAGGKEKKQRMYFEAKVNRVVW